MNDTNAEIAIDGAITREQVFDSSVVTLQIKIHLRHIFFRKLCSTYTKFAIETPASEGSSVSVEAPRNSITT